MEMNAKERQADVQSEPNTTNVESEGAISRTSDPPSITFFDFPKNVQIKILKYAGLLRPCVINIAFEKFRAKHDRGICSVSNPLYISQMPWGRSWVDPYSPTCDHPRLPLEVFLASHTARHELGVLFFAQNRFSIYLHGRTEFNLFRDATEWGMQHIRHLHIDLGPRENRFLKLAGGVHRTTMKMWQGFCHNAKERISGLKNFSLRCKVKDLEVASRLMCMMDPFPVLTQCAFHLNHLQDDDIRPVIKRAAWRLTDNLDNKSPFQFLLLPKEVQLLILEKLLIGLPDPYLPGSERFAGLVSFVNRKCQRTAATLPLACCGTCSPVRTMCFCHARQTAFSTSCSCFTSPVLYFLISREVYEDCRRVFFSKNTFTLVEEDPDSIMRSLHYIPTESFMQIRHLSFKFPLNFRAHNKSPRLEETAFLSWSVLRRFVREHFDLPRLSISIVDLGVHNGAISIVSSRNKYMRKMLRAFADLRGLLDFRVYLADDAAFEKELERAVTGRVSIGRFRPYKLPSIGNREL
ncbi:hypothetical protein P175DRAFT_0460057 [Aspergillus ochraceoroseus IBT 24754]|uniref:F-box domain-containing protein n=3 Tax=Aspergillus subgen. Nidulantes TaxID=2720870 RepID=A0A0F8VAU4_9EURO|nr:uncharacterized protein P175DRAFT_0460057 [Aspergillus ochraceoroseus IBT 24754]KKK20136.1 hypothetical protein ARAM_004366 [Aspergillus rambellii]KKK25685.1 hypothetical protein AOCH_007237 [Aspergillus ochraceoroseus]PTU19895.1 hypothetical protein P175DRAFT_0460057 [Aspergillus ochraceoroseus IBT 24754]